MTAPTPNRRQPISPDQYIDQAEVALRQFHDGNPTRDQAAELFAGWTSRWYITETEKAELLSRFPQHPFETASASAGPRWKDRP